MVRSRLELVTDALRSASDHYGILVSRFATLDTKAQGAATVAGGLLAASVAFVGQTLFKETLKAYPRAHCCFLGLGLFVLMALLSTAGVLKTRPLRSPYRADLVIQEVEDLIGLNDNERTDDLVFNLYQRQLSRWRAALTDVATAVASKSQMLFVAHACIAAAAVCVALYLFLILSV